MGAHKKTFLITLLCLWIPASHAGFDFDPKAGCGGEVTKKIILPSESEGMTALNELEFRQQIQGAAKSLVLSQYESWKQVSQWVWAYAAVIQDPPKPVPGQPRLDPETLATQAMERAIEKHLSSMGQDERASEVLKYFGIHYPAVSPGRIQHLLQGLLIQCYLARFEELTLQKLAVRAPIDTPLLNASGELVLAVNWEVAEEMRDPKRLEERFLTILPRMPLRTMGVVTDDSGAVQEAYLKADALALEAAKAKAQAMYLDPSLPDVARDFAKNYLLSVSLRPQGQVHPLLIDWVDKLEAFATPD